VRRLLFFASAVVLVDTSFYAAITPLLPDLTTQFGLSKTGAGVLAATYPAGTFVGGLPGGWLAAKWGVKPTVILGLLLMSVASVGFAFGDSIVVLDVSRFVQGLAGAASWAGAMAWLTAGSPADRRGALIGSAMGAAIFGALLGPVVGVAADQLGNELVFCTIGAVGVALALWALQMPAAKPNADSSLRRLIASLSDGRIRSGLLLITLPGLLFGTMAVLGPLRMHDLGASAVAIGATWLVAAAFEAIVSPLAGRYSDRHGRNAPLLGGLVAGMVTFALLPWPESA
jgi:MFS family permease